MPDGMNFTGRIIAPGVYDLPSDVYHSDPAETPSLSAGMINDLLIAPAKCRENSRRLNPDWEEPEGAEKFTIGSVSHTIFLEPHQFESSVVVVPFDDWRKKEAKDAREDAKAEGKIAILEKHMAKIHKARAAFFANEFTRNAFANGKAEQSIFWQHKTYGFWCRMRPDFMADALTHLCDYKATGNAEPANFGRHAANMGYHRRAAWYLEGMEAVFGKRPEHYWFCCQEIKAPFLPAVIELDMQALEAGQDENDYAAELFARCLETGDWHGYRDLRYPHSDRAFREGLPTYALMQIDRRLGRDGRSWPKPRAEQIQYEDVE